MKLSIVIVSWNTRQLLSECLSSLYSELQNLDFETEVLVCDNGSSDDSVKMVQENFPEVKLIDNKENLGFGRANNIAFSKASGEYILLLNPDTVVLPNSIRLLMQFAKGRPSMGIVAPQLLNSDGSIQRSCRSFPSLSGMFYELAGLSKLFKNNPRFRTYKMLDFDHCSTRQVDQPEGACLLIPKAVLDQVGWFDEKFFMLFEEVDLCLRVKKAGYEIWFYPESKIVHHYGQSIKKVKIRMMYHSHKGMFHYWSKHNSGFISTLIKPFLYVGLVLLLFLRIAVYGVKKYV